MALCPLFLPMQDGLVPRLPHSQAEQHPELQVQPVHIRPWQALHILLCLWQCHPCQPVSELGPLSTVETQCGQEAHWSWEVAEISG